MSNVSPYLIINQKYSDCTSFFAYDRRDLVTPYTTLTPPMIGPLNALIFNIQVKLD